MKTFLVCIPICGTITTEVQAEDEEQAKEIAFETAGDNIDECDLQWEMLEHIVKGNVFYGDLNKIEVQELVDQEPEEDEEDK